MFYAPTIQSCRPRGDRMHQSEGDEETGDSCLRSQDQDAQIIPFGSPLKGPFPAFIPFCTPLQRLFHVGTLSTSIPFWPPLQRSFHVGPFYSFHSILAPLAAFVPCWVPLHLSLGVPTIHSLRLTKSSAIRACQRFRDLKQCV